MQVRRDRDTEEKWFTWSVNARSLLEEPHGK